MILCALCLNQLAFESWRQGEAAWWLAANGDSPMLSSNVLDGRVLLVNVLSHCVTLSTLIAAIALWPLANGSARRIRVGQIALCITASAVALLAGQILFALLLLATSISWFEPRSAGC
jgi:hypothetical protein